MILNLYSFIDICIWSIKNLLLLENQNQIKEIERRYNILCFLHNIFNINYSFFKLNKFPDLLLSWEEIQGCVKADIFQTR